MTKQDLLGTDIPFAYSGQKIGLLGGSFDPPHQGHVKISLEALKRFRLDQIWWLVSPGNPLKDHGPAPLRDRLEASRNLISHPRIRITDIEARLGTRYTSDSLAALCRLRPQLRFVWLMGADNMDQLHLWQDWRTIMEMVPVGVLARPGARIPARTSRAARIYDFARIPGRQAGQLGAAPAPQWCFVNMPMSHLSSSAIRLARE